MVVIYNINEGGHEYQNCGILEEYGGRVYGKWMNVYRKRNYS